MAEKTSLPFEVIVKNPDGKPLIRCSHRQATHYLKKGYAFLDGDCLRFIDNTTEQSLLETHGCLDHPFFLAEKYHQCVCCGIKEGLTRHHVIPRRHVKTLPLKVRKRLCNTVSLCDKCHQKYEEHSRKEPVDYSAGDPVLFSFLWRNHFLDVLCPKHLPEGWDIILNIPDEFKKSEHSNFKIS